MAAQLGAGARREELGNDLASIGDLYRLPRANQTHVVAQPVLQLPQPHCPHAGNVASWGTLSSRRLTPGPQRLTHGSRAASVVRVNDSPKSKRLADGSATCEPPERASLLTGVLLVALVVGAHGLETNPGLAQVTGKPGEEALMKRGVDALYTRNDPATAALRFREVLAQNPEHYVATFQLATALDRAGRSAVAQSDWEKMLPMAEAAKDEETAATARARLQARAGPVSDEALMKTGLVDLYTRNDPGAAADQFRKVLERNPTHYGATFQLAMALDRGGKRTEAHPLWEKVLKMAESYKDKATADHARARLAQNP